MPQIPLKDYGLKVFKAGQQENTNDRKNLQFTSTTSTYILARARTVKVNSNPYVVVHGLGYVPKAFVFEILSDHNRKLPYDDGTGMRDFSLTKNEIKIKGVTSGTFKILLFGQNIL